MSKERRTKLSIAILGIGLSALAVVPFFFMGQSKHGEAFEVRMPTTHDMFLHYDQMKSFYNGLAAGEIYPRWEEDTNRGFGAPTTSFYPPGIYYLTSAIYSVTGDWLRTLLGAHLLMMIASAAALYFYARRVMGRAAAVTAMTAYVILPYHLTDQYHRGAIAELLGFVWMPLILMFCDRVMKAPGADETTRISNRRSTFLDAAGLAICYGAFLWSHPPTAYQFTLGLGAYLLALAIMQRQWKGLLVVSVAIALGVGLSAAYLVSAAIEQNLIHKEFISETWPYHDTYIFVHSLYSAELYSGFFKLLDWIWITGTALIAAVALLLLGVRRRVLASAPALRQRVVAWVILGGLASFMMVKASMPIGKLIPKLDIGVFTWRMLSITTLVTALLIGSLAQAAALASRNGSRGERLVFASLAAVIVIGFVGFSAIAVVRPMISAPVFEPETEHINYATIPATAPDDPRDLAADIPRAELASENGTVSVEDWKPQHRVIHTALTDDDVLLVKTFNFPGWVAVIDGRPQPIDTNPELGVMEIKVSKGDHIVTLDFLDTPVRRYGRLITLASVGVIAALCAVHLGTGRRREKDATSS
jgi:hypothetical protein